MQTLQQPSKVQQEVSIPYITSGPQTKVFTAQLFRESYTVTTALHGKPLTQTSPLTVSLHVNVMTE